MPGASRADLRVRMPPRPPRQTVQVHRAARPRRRLLPAERLLALARTARAASLPELVPQRVRAVRPTASAPLPGPSTRRASPRAGVPARPICCSGGGSAGRSGAVLRWWLGEVASARRRLPLDHVRDQRRRLRRPGLPARPAPVARTRRRWRPRSGPACSAASRPCRRTPSRRGRSLADGDTLLAGGLRRRHAGRLPGRGRRGRAVSRLRSPRRGRAVTAAALVALGAAVGAAAALLARASGSTPRAALGHAGWSTSSARRCSGCCVGLVGRRARRWPCWARLLRGLHDVLHVRGADRGLGPRRGTAYAVATVVASRSAGCAPGLSGRELTQA